MTRFVLFALLALSSLAPVAAEEGRPIVIGRSYTLASKVLGDTRRLRRYAAEAEVQR